ncbi:MAG TPA: 4Fe-4S dicluster domain-containing protein [Candidatus Saccharimonadales bacterium]|nr:4Fe-4S dicluster domain-containing protein [Candidatus Saccharimonadales bacterium]
MSNATLIDTTVCIGCRSCQVSCKQWNGLPAEHTTLPDNKLGFQNPKLLSAKSFVVIQHNEIEDAAAPGGVRNVFVKRQCMHCEDPACVAACPVTAMHKTETGAVAYDAAKCIGCRYCMWACPWGVPTAQWDSLAPKISKCDRCSSRSTQQLPAARNGERLVMADHKSYQKIMSEPVCVKQCPSGALKSGSREELLQEAKRRMHEHPGKYVDHIYGEHEAGGTNTLYLSAVPFEKLGFPKIQTEPFPHYSAIALGSVPPAVVGVGALLGGAYKLSQRRAAVAAAEEGSVAVLDAPVPPSPKVKASRSVEKYEAPTQQKEHHPKFAAVSAPLWTTANKLLAALMGFGGLSFLLRFVMGIGTTTNLSDTYAWGLWIIFDLVWIAVAAGAFATAGLIYVFQRKDLYSIGRSAVLMGLLSYSFVTVTLLADLGLPWHFYALALNSPKHSAMFEVSWCVGLYVTILLLEFLPVPFERWGLTHYAEMWKKYSPVYVVAAMSLFVFLLSHNLLWVAATAVVFGSLAYAFRTKEGEKPVPIMLAIAAVTLSTMHQSSLGSLFLLMPDKLNHLWWSPMMPISFFLSSVAAGTALMVLVEMWIAKAWNRQLRIKQLAAMGKVAFWSMLIYQVVRLADLTYRGNLNLVGGPKSTLFLAEVLLGGLLPLILLSTDKLRNRSGTLGMGAGLAVAGVVLNRMNVVSLGMTLRGAMPQTTPVHYFPSIFEWGISVGLIAATIFLFGLGVRHMPVLPPEES